MSTNYGTVDSQDGQFLNPGHLYRSVVGQLTDVVLVMDQGGLIVHAECCHPKLAVSESAAHFYDRIHPDDLISAHRAFFRVTVSQRTESITLQYRSDVEDWLWVECTFFMLHTKAGDDFVVVTIKDISQRKQEEEALRQLAFHDPLTGLPNRRLFEEHLNKAVAQAKRSRQLVALFYIDVDDFKLINDRMGHETGDLFLISFAKRVKGCIREIDTLARMGGDEFTLLLPVVDSKQNVEKVAQRIMESVNKGWDIAGARIECTVSVGIAIYPSDGEPIDTLLRNVDFALYEVKSRGRNGYNFYSTGN